MVEWAVALRERRLTAVECLELHLERIARDNPRLNAIVTLNPLAAEEAAAADRAAAEGRFLGPLHGVPFTVKDTLATKGLRTTAGSPLLGDYVPEQSATAVRRLQEAGAVLLGKTQLFGVRGGNTQPQPALRRHLESLGHQPHVGRFHGRGQRGRGLGHECLRARHRLWRLHPLAGPLHRPDQPAAHPRAWCPETGLLPYVPPAAGEAFPPPTRCLPCTGSAPWPGWPGAWTTWACCSASSPGRTASIPSTVPVPLGGPVGFLGRHQRGLVRGRGYPPRPGRSGGCRPEGRGSPRGPRCSGLLHARPPGLERAAAAFVALRTAEGMPEVVELATGREDELGSSLRNSLLGAEPSTVADYRKAAAERDAIRAQVLGFMAEHNILLLPVASVPASDPRTGIFNVSGKDISVDGAGVLLPGHQHSWFPGGGCAVRAFQRRPPGRHPSGGPAVPRPRSTRRRCGP